MAGAAPAEEKPAEEKPEDSEPDDPDKISVTRNGEPIGPYSREKAKEYFASGQLLPTDWGWHDGMDDWKPINEVLGVSVPGQTTAAAGKSGKGKKVAIIAGIVVLLSGLIFAGITYGPDLVAKISGGSLEKKVVGEYEYKAKGARVEKWVFLDNGIAEIYAQDHKEGKWLVVDGEIHVKTTSNDGYFVISVWRINKDGSITNIAFAHDDFLGEDDGKQTEVPQSSQITLKKIK
jgi:hypothetical protein